MKTESRRGEILMGGRKKKRRKNSRWKKKGQCERESDGKLERECRRGSDGNRKRKRRERREIRTNSESCSHNIGTEDSQKGFRLYTSRTKELLQKTP